MERIYCHDSWKQGRSQELIKFIDHCLAVHAKIWAQPSLAAPLTVATNRMMMTLAAIAAAAEQSARVQMLAGMLRSPAVLASYHGS